MAWRRRQNRADYNRKTALIPARNVTAFPMPPADGDRCEAIARRADVSVYPPHELRSAVDFFFAFFFWAENSLMGLFPLKSEPATCDPLCPASGFSVANAGIARPTQPAAARINVSFLICSSICS